jgi:hypothetical protein
MFCGNHIISSLQGQALFYFICLFNYSESCIYLSLLHWDSAQRAIQGTYNFVTILHPHVLLNQSNYESFSK